MACEGADERVSGRTDGGGSIASEACHHTAVDERLDDGRPRRCACACADKQDARVGACVKRLAACMPFRARRLRLITLPGLRSGSRRRASAQFRVGVGKGTCGSRPTSPAAAPRALAATRLQRSARSGFESDGSSARAEAERWRREAGAREEGGGGWGGQENRSGANAMRRKREEPKVGRGRQQREEKEDNKEWRRVANSIPRGD